jgi:hypothetical protein
MTRAAAHVDAHDCTPRVRRSRAARDEDDVRRVAVDAECDASRRQGLDERVLDDATKLKRRCFEVGRCTDLDREAEVLAVREPVVRRERGQ